MKLVLLCLVLAACSGVKLNANDPPLIEHDASCEDMCAAFRRLECVAAKPSPRLGITCEERCARALSIGLEPPRACVARAVTAADIGRCGEVC